MMRVSSTRLILVVVVVVVVVALSAKTVQGNIQNMDIIMPPTQEFVQYADGYIRGPGGVIDLSQLQFQPISASMAYYNNAEYYDEDDEELFYKEDENLVDQALELTQGGEGNESVWKEEEATIKDEIEKYEENNIELDETKDEQEIMDEEVAQEMEEDWQEEKELEQEIVEEEEEKLEEEVFEVIKEEEEDAEQGASYQIVNETEEQKLDEVVAEEMEQDWEEEKELEEEIVEEEKLEEEMFDVIANEEADEEQGENYETVNEIKEEELDEEVAEEMEEEWQEEQGLEEEFQQEQHEEEMFEVIKEEEEEEEEQGVDDEDGFGGRTRRRLEEVSDSFSVVDIVVFPLPYKCVKKGCDWSELGVGKKSDSNDDNDLRWCCSDESIELGLCGKQDYGKLLIDESKFKGQHRTIDIPKDGDGTPFSLGDDGIFDEDQSGRYVVLYANCNEKYGRDVAVNGPAVWKSAHGYLPGELYGFFYFFVALTIIYFVLYAWYNGLMKKHEAHRIEIEKWIRTVIALGCAELFLRTLDYIIWNATGQRSQAIIWCGILSGNFKQGFSRCLLVMVSMGWGVVRDSLGSSMKTIVFMGLVYIATSVAMDFLLVLAIESVNVISYRQEQGLFDVVTAFRWARFLIDAIFTVWILDALKNTMHYLEKSNQQRKLERTRQLRAIFFVAVAMAASVSLFLFIDNVKEDGIIQEEQAWAKDATSEVVYLFILASIAILWRPNPAAKEYAYAMELPTFDDDDDDVDDLNLSDYVPSALDDHEDF